MVKRRLFIRLLIRERTYVGCPVGSNEQIDSTVMQAEPSSLLGAQAAYGRTEYVRSVQCDRLRATNSAAPKRGVLPTNQFSYFSVFSVFSVHFKWKLEYSSGNSNIKCIFKKKAIFMECTSLKV